MSWTTTADPHAFMAAAGAFLRADPAANTVILTRVAAMRAPEAGALLGFWQPPAEPLGGGGRRGGPRSRRAARFLAPRGRAGRRRLHAHAALSGGPDRDAGHGGGR